MLDIVIVGTGGHAKVVYDILKRQKMFNPVAFVSLNEGMNDFLGLPHVHQSKLQEEGFKSGVVAIGDNFLRSQVTQFIQKLNPAFELISAVHPSAQIASDVLLGVGTVVMANVVVNPGTCVASNVILNTGSVIDHDCKLDQFSSIAPGSVLGGNVQVGEFSAVSIGSNVIHGKIIGSHTVIGAGSVVLNDIPNFVVAYGSPCKVVRSRTQGEKYL